MKQIDDQAYKDGGAAFNKGKTLRSVVELMMVKKEEEKDWQQTETFFNSYALGFADALLAKLRSK